MKQNVIIICMLAILGLAPQSEAVIVELPLDGAVGTYQGPGPSYWETNFDLGVTFSQITNVHIDWSGEIMAPTVTDTPGGTPVPIELGIIAGLTGSPYSRFAIWRGGEDTYPAAEPFAELSRFTLEGTANWNDLLDGTGRILIAPDYLITPGQYVDHGYIQLDSATLVIDGTLVPEPATIALLMYGSILATRKRHRFRTR